MEGKGWKSTGRQSLCFAGKEGACAKEVLSYPYSSCVDILAGFHTKGRDEVAETNAQVEAKVHNWSPPALQDRFPNKAELQDLNKTEKHLY